MSDLLRLGRRIADLEDQLHAAVTAPQLAYSSIPDGAIDQTVSVPTEEVDADGNVIYRTEVASRFGMQDDGSNTVVSFTGPTPPRPVGHTVTAGPESLSVEWFGEFEDRIEPYMDHDYVAVHVGTTAGFAPMAATLKGTIRAWQGEALSVPLSPGTYFVSLVAVSAAGIWSAPSPYAEGAPVSVLQRLTDVEAEAAAARALAIAADNKAIAAQADATTALTAANGVSQIHYATVAPAPSDGKDGDTWYVRAAGSQAITAVYEKVSGSWSERRLTSAVIDSLDAGKITTGTLAAGASITTGSASGTHTVLGASALQVWRPDPDGVPQVTASFGGATADEMRFVDSVTGLERAAISSDGTVRADTVDADVLLTQGESVRDLLSELPRGLQRVHQVPNGDRSISYTTTRGEYGVSRVICPVTPGRTYRVTLDGIINMTTLGASTNNCETRLRYTTDGTAPLITSAVMAQSFKRWYISLAGEFKPIFASSIIRIPAGCTTLQVASTIKANTPGAVFQAKSQAGYAWTMMVEDLGVDWDGLADDGAITAAGGGGGETPPDNTNPVTRTVQYGISASRSWKGSSVSDDNGYLRHGVYSSTQRSMLAFHSQMLSDMPGATISRVRVRLKAEHWYNNNGGATNVGAHSYTTLPSGFSRLTTYTQTIPTWTSKTGVQWFDLPSSWFAGINGSSPNGVIRGLTFGDGDSGISNYGYFNGDPSSAASVRPIIEVTFTK